MEQPRLICSCHSSLSSSLGFYLNEKTPWWVLYYVGISFKTIYSLNHQYRYKEKLENIFSPPF